MRLLNIRVSNDLADRLGYLASKTGRTKSYYIREALESKIEELEDFYFAVQSLEKVASGKSKLWSQEDLEQARDLEN